MLAAVALEAHRVGRGRWRLDGRLGNGLNLRDSAGVLGVSVPVQRGNDKTEAAVSVPLFQRAIESHGEVRTRSNTSRAFAGGISNATPKLATNIGSPPGLAFRHC